MTMTLKELQELMKLMNRHKLVEFNMKDGEFEISMRSEQDTPPQQVQMIPAPTYAPIQQAAPAQAAAPAAPPPATADDTADAAPAAPAAAASSKQIAIKSPMPGTFYRSSSPDKPAFVKVGDVIESGQVVCMIEAMKLFNELESEISGRIVKVLIEDAQPVEYDQVLFMVEP